MTAGQALPPSSEATFFLGRMFGDSVRAGTGVGAGALDATMLTEGS